MLHLGLLLLQQQCTRCGSCELAQQAEQPDSRRTTIAV
jgi:hypothetical protein